MELVSVSNHKLYRAVLLGLRRKLVTHLTTITLNLVNRTEFDMNLLVHINIPQSFFTALEDSVGSGGLEGIHGDINFAPGN